MTQEDTLSSKGAVFPPWDLATWRAVDDRVRGGSSHSHLDPIYGHSHIRISDTLPDSANDEKDGRGGQGSEVVIGARFWGNLDIETLGGAGFASQQHLFAPIPLYLPRLTYSGLALSILLCSTSAIHTFTLVLKSTLPATRPNEPKRPPNSEPASLVYEANFVPNTTSSSPFPFTSLLSQDPSSALSDQLQNSGQCCDRAYDAGQRKVQDLHFSWDEFIPHYRGREVKRDDPKYQPFRPETIYEIGFMVRSGFGKQEGDFDLGILGVRGRKQRDVGDRQIERDLKEKASGTERGGEGGWLTGVWGLIVGMFGWVMRLFGERVGAIRLDEEEKRD